MTCARISASTTPRSFFGLNKQENHHERPERPDHHAHFDQGARAALGGGAHGDARARHRRAGDAEQLRLARRLREVVHRHPGDQRLSQDRGVPRRRPHDHGRDGRLQHRAQSQRHRPGASRHRRADRFAVVPLRSTTPTIITPTASSPGLKKRGIQDHRLRRAGQPAARLHHAAEGAARRHANSSTPPSSSIISRRSRARRRSA